MAQPRDARAMEDRNLVEDRRLRIEDRRSRMIMKAKVGQTESGNQSHALDPRSSILHPRSSWTSLTDEQLLNQCKVDTYRASGPGGQKRNKPSSAVRLRHMPSGLIVIAEESRSQHENRVRALRRLRQALFLKIRDDLAADSLTPETLQQRDDYREARNADGRL